MPELMDNAAYFGGYRTRSFAEIFPDFATFQAAYQQSAFPDMLLTGTGYENFGLSTIFSLLMARYFESHIATDSEDAFKLKIMGRIYQHGQAWQREMFLQQKYISMSDAEIIAGSKAVYNHAKNPSTAPSTGSLEELTYIDEQNVTTFKKYGPDAWRQISASIDPDICKRFTDKFRDLFIKVTAPDYPLYYEEEATNG